MTVLSDTTLYQYIRDHKMIEPFNVSQLNPSSYDLQIGTTAQYESAEGDMRPLDMTQYSKEEPLKCGPGTFLLASSLETFNLPENICAFVKLKSSRGREGWDHLMAGWCDPGWHGSVLTMELKNVRQFKNLPFYSGLLMVQMVFLFVDKPPSKLYHGSYNNHTTVHGSVHEA